MSIWDRLQTIDRRLIFVLIGLVVAVPLVWPPKLKLEISPPTKAVYDYIETLKPGSVVAIAFDYGPSSAPELDPMAYSLMRQSLTNDVSVIVLTLNVQGKQLKTHALSSVVRQLRAEGVELVGGEDYLDLPYEPGYSMVVLGMGTDLHRFFRVATADGKTQPIGAWPVMQRVRRLSDIALTVDLASSDTPGTWVAYGQARFGAKIAAGVTAVMAADYYPFLQSKQLVGLINGLKGAAEYEQLLGQPGLGLSGMGAQRLGHIVIIVFVLLGNLAYFASRRTARRTQGSSGVS